MKKFLVLALVFKGLFAAGPFGLEIGKSKIDDVKNAINCKYSESSIISGVYPNNGYYLSYEQCNLMDGLKSVDFAFDDDGVLVFAELIFDGKDYYNTLKSSLNQKYKISKTVEPFVGNKLSEYSLNKEKITLNSPHMSFDVFLTYEQNEFMNKVKKAKNNQKAKEQEERTNLL